MTQKSPFTCKFHEAWKSWKFEPQLNFVIKILKVNLASRQEEEENRYSATVWNFWFVVFTRLIYLLMKPRKVNYNAAITVWFDAIFLFVAASFTNRWPSDLYNKCGNYETDVDLRAFRWICENFNRNNNLNSRSLSIITIGGVLSQREMIYLWCG